MKPKAVLLTFLKSLISNDAAIEGAKKAPWWMALVLGIFSVGLPLIPIAVTANNQRGSAALSGYGAGQEVALTQIALDAKANEISFEVKDGECLYKVSGEVKAIAEEDMLKPIETYTSSRHEIVYGEDGKVQSDTETKEHQMMLFYTADSNTLSDYVKLIESKHKYVVGTITEASETDPEETSYYTPSYIVIHKEGLYVALYQQSTLSKFGLTEFKSDWAHTGNGDIITRILANEDIEASDQTVKNLNYTSSVYANFRGIVDETYLTSKGVSIRNSLLIFGGVYIALVLLMGLMMFLLTRGKNNPFNYLHFGITLKIACWASFTPSLLALGLGFLITQFAPYIFIILIGLRVMWLSMRQLRPYN